MTRTDYPINFVFVARLLQHALLGIEEEVAGDEELATGYDSLVNRGLIEEQEDGTYTVNDELIVMTAVASRPQTVVTVIAAAAEPGTEAAAEAAAVVETIVAAGDPANAPTPPGRSAYRYFEWEDAIVELTYPDADGRIKNLGEEK